MTERDSGRERGAHQVAQRAARLIEGIESGEYIPIDNLFLPKDKSPEEILEHTLQSVLTLQEKLDTILQMIFKKSPRLHNKQLGTVKKYGTMDAATI